ncbi:hypothetical protein AB6A40_005866 [Gnathostoma spinigerum]|uniref:Uncharacterized protein n=1 Tax=Gnathostoma spinigerum TaxID=75299 RepID=A0ABD6ER49_9BILA
MYFFHPRWKALLDISVWGQAAVQVFYSLSVCTGGLGTLASYNRFHNNVLKDAVILSVIDTITCLLTASLVFSAVGFFCYEVSMELKGFDLKGGSYLLFVVLPETIAKLPVAPLYSLLYFIMVFFVILTTSVFLIETVVSGICDEFPERLRRNHRHVLTLICLCFYCLGVPLCTAAGIYWIHLLDHFITMLPLVTLSFFECMVICWVYGADNFLDNIKWMTGSYPPPYIAWKILWKFLSPVLYITLISFIFFGYQPVFYEDHRYPSWAYSVGWIISLLPALCVTVVALFEFCFTKGSCANRGRTLLCPESDWGPALAVHRAEYYPLQVPEARRLILPPASNFNTDKHGTSVDVLPNREEVAYCGSNNKLDKRQETRSGTTQSNSNHKRNHLPSFDRETAI